MNCRTLAQTLLCACTFSVPAFAQDSLSLNGCLPGDAVDLWADGSSPSGSEQENRYVVDMTPFFSAWGSDFAVAPLVKTSKGNFSYFNHLMGAQGISRKVLGLHAFSADDYSVWSGPGFGVNNNSGTNLPGTSINTSDFRGAQFATVFREMGTTDASANSTGVVTSIVNVDPSDTSRLFVRRINSAVNACDSVSDLSTFGVGAVDAEGYSVIRSDGFGIVLGGCGQIIQGNNILIIDAANRNPAMRNVIEDTGLLMDVPATNWVVPQSGITHGSPTMIPSTVTGGAPVYIGTDFNTGLVRGTNSANVISDQSHLAPGVNATRGNLSYTTDNFTLFNSTHGIAATLSRIGPDTDTMNVFGLNGSGNVTGVMALTLPPVVVDNATGFTNLGPGPNEFDNYHSQVPFQGGNGNIALRVDALGNLLCAAQVDHPTDTGPTHAGNYIAVARVNGQTGATSWTMAGYNDDASSGKPILNAPSSAGGIAIGQMIPRSLIGLAGPSVSSPMIDSAGNVWFLSTVELFGVNTFTTALLRGIYNPVSFSYELDLVMKVGDKFFGGNSQRSWMLTDLRIADSNSIDSATAWSGNMSDDAFLGYDRSYFGPDDPRALGGLVLQGRALYDYDQDGNYDDDCQTTFTLDEEYRVLLYISPNFPSGYEYYGTSCPGTGGISPILAMDGYPTPGGTITLSIQQGLGGSMSALLLGLSKTSIPFGANGCVLNTNALPAPVILLPLGGSGAGQGSITIPAPLPASLPPGLTIDMQAFVAEPTIVGGLSGSRGLELVIQP